MHQMKHPVPAWLLQLAWFLAGVFATGAVWFYLSKKECLLTWLSVVAAIALVVVAVQLHRVNDRDSRFRARREALAELAEQANVLSLKASEEPLPIAEHNDWVARAEEDLRRELDASYVARFNNFSGMIFYGDRSPRSQFKTSLDGRTGRLHEFMREFSE